MSRPILVTGVGGPAGRSLLNQLSARGIPVSGVDSAPVPAARIVPRADDPAFVAELSTVVRRIGARMVIPTVTEELPVLAGTELDVPVVIGQRSAVLTAQDKWLTFLRLVDFGVPVPQSCLAGTMNSAGLGGMPLLSKPRVGRGGRGVIVHQPDEPADAFGTDDRIVQEYITGKEYVVNVYLCASPGCDVVQALEKTELSGGMVGNAVAVRPVDEPRIARLASYAVLALGLRGPADVDIRLRSDGSPVVLEINARFGAHSARSPAMLDTLLAERLAGTR